MTEEGMLGVAPALEALDPDSDLERGNPIETERSPLLGAAGTVVYNATGTTKGVDTTPATIGHATNGEVHRDSDGDGGGDGGGDGDDAATCRHVSRTHLLTIICTLCVRISPLSRAMIPA